MPLLRYLVLEAIDLCETRRAQIVRSGFDLGDLSQDSGLLRMKDPCFVLDLTSGGCGSDSSDATLDLCEFAID